MSADTAEGYNRPSTSRTKRRTRTTTLRVSEKLAGSAYPMRR